MKKINRLYLLIVLGLVLIQATAFGNVFTKLFGKEKSVEIEAYGGLDPQVSAQQIIADKMGYFEEEGIVVNNHLMSGPTEIAPLVANGVAEVAFGAIYDNIAVAANNVKVKVLAPLANAGGTQAVVVRNDVKIDSAKDLEGKKFAMSPGAGVLIAIRNMCDDLGVDINKIQFVNLQPADQLSAFTRGDVDVIASWEPWIGKSVDAGGTELFSGTKANLPEKKGDVNWIDFYATVQVTQDFYDEHPKEIVKMLKALDKATDFINENPEKAAAVIAKEIKIDEAECLRIMKKNIYSMKFDTQFKEGSEIMANFMKEMKNIREVPDFDKYTSSDMLSKADVNLVSID
jgi:NitT/TauT family transport system substrate-binding protein